MRKNIIVDLDGTLAFDDHRRPLIEKEGWDAYFGAVGQDEPNEALIDLLAIIGRKARIHIITGRCNSTRGETVKWLNDNKVHYHNLIMRPETMPYPDLSKPLTEQNFVSDQKFKLSISEMVGLTPNNTLMVLDDRDEMTQFWRSLGFSCWQVREEGYHLDPMKQE